MEQQQLFGLPDDDERVVYCMTITLKNGKKIRRPGGGPFRFVVRSKRDR